MIKERRLESKEYSQMICFLYFLSIFLLTDLGLILGFYICRVGLEVATKTNLEANPEISVLGP